MRINQITAAREIFLDVIAIPNGEDPGALWMAYPRELGEIGAKKAFKKRFGYKPKETSEDTERIFCGAIQRRLDIGSRNGTEVNLETEQEGQNVS